MNTPFLHCRTAPQQQVFAMADAHGKTSAWGPRAYPPYKLPERCWRVDGFEREVATKLLRPRELTCEWSQLEMGRIIPNLTSGNYEHHQIAGMSIPNEREEVIDFTQKTTSPPAASAYAAKSA